MALASARADYATFLQAPAALANIQKGASDYIFSLFSSCPFLCEELLSELPQDLFDERRIKALP